MPAFAVHVTHLSHPLFSPLNRLPKSEIAPAILPTREMTHSRPYLDLAERRLSRRAHIADLGAFLTICLPPYNVITPCRGSLSA